MAGHREAFVTLYRAHFPDLRAFAQRLLGCPMAADALVHDVFEQLPKALRSFRGEGTLKSYMISIAIRMAKNHLRAAQRRRAQEARALNEPQASPSAPDENQENRQLGELLTAALDRLPLEQRIAFVLCELEELTSAEAGEILGERAGTMRARVYYAKRELREHLSELARARGILERAVGSDS